MNHDVEDKVDSKPTSLNMNVSLKIDDGKNKVDKVIDEIAESERLKQSVKKVKKGVVTTTKFSISFVLIGFIVLVILVALGIVS